ncbi:hypothetical protein CSIM01_10744 [Colletotrichum simmondsii]|uniref:Uncharacterized protein n=1 Tax=Colletotrichum simmondsii TaxID=703756 RepID=A0A135TUJ4_9PEZI|nr:hypothetical protein CSIM01_10744 [Colletotrichum simmondsii]
MADQLQKNQAPTATNESSNPSKGVVALELFLEITDRYVESAYAQAAAESSTWHIEGCPDAIDSIYISDNHAYDYASQKKRWRLVSTLANLRSRRVSGIVDRTFCKFPRHHHVPRHHRTPEDFREWYTTEQKSNGIVNPPKHAWVLPDIDVFVLDFKAADCHNNADGANPEPLETAILQPSQEAAGGPLRMIRNVRSSLKSLMTASSKQIRVLAALPELRRVQTWCAIRSPVQPADEPLHDHAAVMPIDRAFLPDLAVELALSGTRLLLLWEPLFDAGVKIVIQPRSYATLLFAFVIFYDNLERPTPPRSLSHPSQMNTMRWSTKFHNVFERIKFGIRGTTLPSGILPYEIWLSIVDAVIDDLESTVEPLTWVLTGYESEKVTDENRCLMLDQSKPPWFYRVEHFLIDDARNWEKGKIKHRQDAMEVLYNFTLVDRRTREIINRRLPRCTFFHRNWFQRGRPLEKPSTSVRIVPSIDLFPYFVRCPAPHSHMKRWRALFSPWEYHGCVEPFSHVQTILLSAILLRPGWADNLKHHFQYLQKMPSLKSVEFRAKRPYSDADETTYYTVEDNLLVFLPGDENLDMDEIISMWRSLKDRGVRFTASHCKALVEFT